METRPNILLLFTDMQRFDTIHALGNPVIKTPNLDRLVREGTSFTSAYSPSPVCVPARWCMHYGQYTRKSGLYKNGRMPDDNGRSLPALLSSSGYKTKAIGKCHFTPERNALRGFDSRLTQEEGYSDPDVDDYCKWLNDNGYDFDEPHGTRGEMYYIPQISLHSEKDHPTQWIGDNSAEFIRDNSGKGEPWFLFSSFIHPHPPCAPPKPWHKLYRAPLMPLPKVADNPENLYTWINRHQNRYKYRDNGIDNNLMRNLKAYYYATISFVDFQIGRILDALEKTGELDNTLIIFTSDHGEFLGDNDCFGKRSMHDPASRVPMIVRGPGFKPGETCESPVNLVDIMPTAAAACGLKATDSDGVDLATVAAGSSDRKYVFSQFENAENGIYMIVSREWKYFYSAGDRREYFFDRVNDPDETRNKAGLPMLNEVKNTLKQALLEYLKQENATEAFVETEQGLDWREYPHLDMSYLEDPDNGLLIQDHDAYVLDRPGYTD